MNKLIPKLFTCLLLVFGALSLQAQVNVSGKVTDVNNEPLIGVSVVVKGTTLGTVTDFDGMYSITVPNVGDELDFLYLGYKSETLNVAEGVTQYNLSMSEDVNKLDEVVITGLASNVKRKNLANAVESIGAREITGVTSQPTMEGALYGKLKGAEIRSNSGAPGGGMSVKLRGVTSIFGGQQPLYIVDGVFMDNSTISLGTNIVSEAAGGGNTATNQDDASNRIADLITEDIESIEVLKGASASGIYGSRAAAGVVIITTKKGKAGKPEVTLSQTVGASTAIRLLGTRDWDRNKILEIHGENAAALYDQNGLTDYEKELYGNTGFNTTTQLAYSGGADKTTFYISGVHKDEEGIVKNTGYRKSSVRANVNHRFNNKLSLDFSSNYINAVSDRGFFNNGNTNTTIGYAQAFTYPWEDLFPDESGRYPAGGAGSNILETVSLVTNQENVNRFLNSAIANYTIFQSDNQSLKLIGTFGRDQYNLHTNALFPADLSFFRAEGTLGGVAIEGNTRSTVDRLAGFLVHNFYAPNGISFTTQAGLTGENFDRNTVLAVASGLNGVETSLSQAANQAVTHNRLKQKDRGFFVQEEVNVNDKFLFTLGLRGDKSTNNGDANKLYYYPKANAALNLHEFAFWNRDGIVNSLKLRTAYGEAGTFSGFYDRFNALSSSAIGGSSGLVTSTLRGNSEVGPERQKELEIGADLGLLNNKVSLEVTWYNKNLEDVLLRQQVPASSGYSRQVVNAAELNNQGLEISLGIRPIETEKLTWVSTFNWWTNQSEVTSLKIPAFNLGGFAASLGQYRIQEGKSATQIVGTYDPADCPDGDCSGIDPDGDGFRVYGDAAPDFNLGWVNSLKFGNFDFSMVWHWKKGGDGVNLSTLLYDLAGTTWDYDDKTLDPSGQLGNGDYRTSEWSAGNASPWIEDASYLRMREVGLYYNISKDILNFGSLRVGVSGRNLLNFYDYNSYDPEVSNFGGNVLANSIEVTPFPSSKRFNFHVTATF